MSTDGNSKTVQKLGKNLNNSVPIAYRYNVEYVVKSVSTLVIVCAQIKMSTDVTKNCAEIRKNFTGFCPIAF